MFLERSALVALACDLSLSDQKSGFFFRPTRLILVSDPEQKIQIIERKLVAGNGLLVVIDDLSYNTENGNTQFYDDVIRYLHSRKHRLRHIGKEKIDKINRNFSTSD